MIAVDDMMSQVSVAYCTVLLNPFLTSWQLTKNVVYKILQGILETLDAGIVGKLSKLKTIS